MSYATTSSLPVPQAGQLTHSFQLLINCDKIIQQFFISTCKQECIFQMRFSTETSIFQHKTVNAFRPENPSLFPLQHVGAGCRCIRGGRGQRAAAGAELTREATLASPPPRTPSPPPQTPGRGRWRRLPAWLRLREEQGRRGKGCAPTPTAAQGPRRAQLRLPPNPRRAGSPPAYPPVALRGGRRRCAATSRLSPAPAPASSLPASAASSPAPASSAAIPAASFGRRLGRPLRAAGPPPAVPATFPAGPAAAPLRLHGCSGAPAPRRLRPGRPVPRRSPPTPGKRPAGEGERGKWRRPRPQ